MARPCQIIVIAFYIALAAGTRLSTRTDVEEAANFVQSAKNRGIIQINGSAIQIIGNPTTAVARNTAKGPAIVQVPNGNTGKKNDIMVMYVASNKAPQPPTPSDGWTEIVRSEPHNASINLKVYWKKYRQNQPSNYTVSGDGKNQWVTMLILRGVDDQAPIVDKMAAPNQGGSITGVSSEKGGAVLAYYVYDGPHKATIKDESGTTTHSKVDTILSEHFGDNHACVLGAGWTNKNNVKPMLASGTTDANGNGHEVASAITFKPKNVTTR